MYITKHWKKNIFITTLMFFIWVSDYQMCVCNLVWFCLCIPTFLQGRILCFNCICIRPRSLCICNCTLWPRRRKADRRILLRIRTRRASVIHQPNHLSQTISAKPSKPNYLSQTLTTISDKPFQPSQPNRIFPTAWKPMWFYFPSWFLKILQRSGR